MNALTSTSACLRAAATKGSVVGARTNTTRVAGRRSGLHIVAATTPQFKSTKHHQRSRPKKTNPSAKNKKPTQYEPLPTPPPEFTVVSAAKAKSSDE